MEKCIIVAIADNNAIGRDNSLLWHISEDLKFFKRKTLGCPVIMGRRTFESIGRPLPKRLNIVVSRRGLDVPDGVVTVPGLPEAYDAAMKGLQGVSDSEGEPRCFIIGGGQIYAQAMQDADRLTVTHVHTVIEDADTFFPAIDPSVWTVAERSEMFHDDESGYTFEFVEYTRQR